ncbi:MAG: hemerythrin domain-containing protein [Candidatus Omnitrophica bacterium]|nr:hemerythrin domain-containing protein [Candidatus Omnitrophota bacterium]
MKNKLIYILGLTIIFIVTFTFLGKEALCAEDVTPVEDLMREHGVLRRVMLIYEREISESEKGKAIKYDVIYKSAGIIHDFIEAYHEKLEEDYIFPIFEKAGKLTDLTRTLREQHKAGRKLTQSILRFSKEKQSDDKENLNALADNLRAFLKMYRPHAAREDTVLFPALHDLISGKEYDELGDKFENKEIELFGKNGFEKIVGKVTDLEKTLGIYNLEQFTHQP